jgi:N-acetylglucosaminyldiphosphoundecaprenol N-acetyl-beta-D-mannosaminyltransferase
MNKVLEYMVFGKPQVMFDLKEGRASAGDAAVYVPENSAIKLAEAIDGLLNNPLRRQEMGQFGKYRSEHELKWENSVENLLAAYNRVLTNGLQGQSEAVVVQHEPIPRRDTRRVLCTSLEVTDYDRLSDYCRALANKPFPSAIEFANTQIVTMRRHEPHFREITDRCFDHFVPDGMPLIWCMNRLGAGLDDRVYGPTFLRHFVPRAPKPLRHFFLGGSDVSSRRLLAQIQTWNPAVEISGAYHGVCREDGSLADESVIEQINRLSPDFIWVGLGTPKQQAFIDRYKKQIQRGVILSVGFAFDVNAGTKRDAPLWMQRRGLTWLFRLATEPRRLGPRYFRYNTLFLTYIMREGIEGRRQRPG